MAVVSTKILHDGWTGSFSIKEIPTFKVVYLVEVDDPQDGNILVVDAAGIPKLGTAYQVGNDFHGGVRCKSLSTTPVAGTRNLWQVTASYGKPEKEEKEEDPTDPTDGVDEEGEPTDDPTKFAANVSMSTTRVSRDAIKGAYIGKLIEQGGQSNFLQGGFNGGNAPPDVVDNVVTDKNGKITNGRPITNSVFKPFDPPVTMDYNRQNIRIKFNTTDSPNIVFPYVNSVNKKAITIKIKYKWQDEDDLEQVAVAKFPIPAYSGRIMGLSVTPSERNGISYHQNSLEIEVDTLYGWRLDILDRGYATLDNEKTFGDSEGKSAPVTKAVVSDDGFADREPVLLDGNGQALKVQDDTDGVFLRYGVYPEMDWSIINIDRPNKMQGDING